MIKEINVHTYKPRFGEKYLSTILFFHLCKILNILCYEKLYLKLYQYWHYIFFQILNDIRKETNKKQTKKSKKFQKISRKY